MINFEISKEVAAAAPSLCVVVVETMIDNAPTSDALWDEILQTAHAYAGTPMEAVNKRPAIAATRAAYKALGKEPNRYRPSSEALCRRCVKGLDLYRSLTAIDLINLLSIRSGHSIGGFDLDKLDGHHLVLGVGREGEPYEAIHRGQLNIACLPVIRDATGGIGTPTSDNERTKLDGSTRRLLMTVNMYDGGGGDDGIVRFVDEMKDLFAKYAGSSDFTINIYKA